MVPLVASIPAPALQRPGCVGCTTIPNILSVTAPGPRMVKRPAVLVALFPRMLGSKSGLLAPAPVQLEAELPLIPPAVPPRHGSNPGADGLAAVARRSADWVLLKKSFD